jgi:murein DD-endopeptidase MepM/ murein hydrolase activator NlpD
VTRRHRSAWTAALLALACAAPATLDAARGPTRVAPAGADSSAANVADSTLVPRLDLAGLLPMEPARMLRWTWSGAWVFPVGDPYGLDAPGPNGTPAFRLSRGVAKDSTGRHDGADLLNGRAGDPVRAAANGLVVRAARASRGYGALIVLAHRLDDGTLAYSVYAHLKPATLAVQPGDMVQAGQPIGHVGRSGRATTHHLHFEIRRPRDPRARWENAPIVDPIAFVAKRLPAAAADTSWARPYLEWAQFAALVHREPADEPLSRATWWTLLARAARRDDVPLPSDPDGLRALLQSVGVLDSVSGRTPIRRPVAWSEMQHDLERLRAHARPLPACRVAGDRHQQLIDERVRAPGKTSKATRGSPPPTLAEALLAIADLSVAADGASP